MQERPSEGDRPAQDASVRLENPGGGVPVSMIIDDSTCLVNLAYYGIPQFREVFPDRYRQNWRALPREIPDAFVRRFIRWSREHGVRGKYSVVPYPACVGWVDRFLPGWSRAELDASLRLIREEVTEDWDIHPEMISHTRVVDLDTGRPYPEASPAYMENWDWSQDQSAEVLAEYMRFALRVLERVDLPCEGITTPGGFGSRNRPNLARATLESVRDVYGTEVPHYFRDLYVDSDRSVVPRVYLARGLDGPDPRCVVSVIGCTGDWFGGWDGLTPGSAERFVGSDLRTGRMVEVIERGEPAIMVAHWPGIYYNGDEIGFDVFKTVVRRLERRYDHLVWMKPSAIARYWAARELTAVRRTDEAIVLDAPFAAEQFTLSVETSSTSPVHVGPEGERRALREAGSGAVLEAGRWRRSDGRLTTCVDLPAGRSEIRL